MNFLITLTLFIVGACGVSDEYVERVRFKMAETAAICIPEVGASNADVLELMNKKPPSTREGKCFVSCFLKKFGFQSETGEPDRERTMALLEPLHDDDPEMYTKVLQVAITCGPRVEKMSITDHCDIAMEIATCAEREAKSLGLEDPFALSG